MNQAFPGAWFRFSYGSVLGFLNLEVLPPASCRDMFRFWFTLLVAGRVRRVVGVEAVERKRSNILLVVL